MKKVKFIAIIICVVSVLFLTACQKEERVVDLLDYDKLVPVTVDFKSSSKIIKSDCFSIRKAVFYVEESEVDDVKKYGENYDFKAGTYALIVENTVDNVVTDRKDYNLKDVYNKTINVKGFEIDDAGSKSVEYINNVLKRDVNIEKDYIVKTYIDKVSFQKVGKIYTRNGCWQPCFKAKKVFWGAGLQCETIDVDDDDPMYVNVHGVRNKDGHVEEYSEHYYDNDKYIMDKSIELYKDGKKMISEKITLSK